MLKRDTINVFLTPYMKQKFNTNFQVGGNWYQIMCDGVNVRVYKFNGTIYDLIELHTQCLPNILSDTIAYYLYINIKNNKVVFNAVI